MVFLIHLILALLTSSATVFAEAKTSGDWKYSVNDDSSGTIVGYVGDEADVVVPAELEGVKITHIGNDAFALPANFSGEDNISSVVLPEGLLEIGWGAFERRKKLTKAVIPKSVERIGLGAFGNCEALLRIEVQSENPTYSSADGVLFDKANKAIFQYPVGKPEKTYTIPPWVEAIGDCAFVKAKNLTEVIIPEGVRVVGLRAFDEASQLQTLVIPASVKTIRENAFFGCTSLANISVPSSSQSFASVDGVLFDKERKVLWQYPAAKGGEYSVPDNVTNIEKFAFQGSRLTNVVVPNSVTAVAERAFMNSALTSATLPDAILSKVDTLGFSDELTATLKATAPIVAEKGASVAIDNSPRPSGLSSLTVGEVTYENVTLKKEYPQSFFIQHDSGTAFIERSKLSEEQIAELLQSSGNEKPVAAQEPAKPEAKTEKAEVDYVHPTPDSLSSEEERKFFEACGKADTATIVAMLTETPSLAKVTMTSQSYRRIMPQMVGDEMTPMRTEPAEATCDALQWLIDESEKSGGRIQAIKALVEGGADPTRTTSEPGCNMARNTVCRPSMLTTEELEYLLSKGANPDFGFCATPTRPPSGSLLLQLATANEADVKEEARKKLELFIAHGANTDKLRQAFHDIVSNPSAEYDATAAKAAGDAELEAILAKVR
jgi:hypothetical protein